MQIQDFGSEILAPKSKLWLLRCGLKWRDFVAQVAVFQVLLSKGAEGRAFRSSRHRRPVHSGARQCLKERSTHAPPSVAHQMWLPQTPMWLMKDGA
jgi:hypothetical protein